MLVAGIYGSNGSQKILPPQAFQYVGARSCLKGSIRQGVTLIGCQNDGPCIGEFAADRDNRVDAVHIRHLDIDQEYVRSRGTIALEGFSSRSCLAYDRDVGLG